MAREELSNLFVRITADTRQFTNATDRVQRQLGGLTRTVGQLAGAFGVAFGAYGAVRFLRGSVQAFAEQEKATETLRAALIATGNDGAGALDKITKSASDLQRVTTAADEAVIQATATLSQLAPSLNADELVRAQQAMIGLAETFTDGNVEAAAVAIGKSLGGTVDLLARWGVGVGTAGDASERLGRLLEKTGKFFDVAGARANTLSGRMQQLRNAYGDLKEQVGDVLAQVAGFGDGATSAKNRIVTLTDAIRENKQQIVEWGKATVALVGDLAKLAAIVAVLRTAALAARGIAIALGAVGVAAGAIPVALAGLAAALTGGAALFIRLKQHADEARTSLIEFRREADRKIAFSVGLPENRDLLVELRNSVSRELERVQRDLAAFRDRLGGETFEIAISSDIDGPFADVRKLADEALVLQKRLVQVNLAIRDSSPAGGGSGLTAAAAQMSELTARTREYSQELAAIPQRVDLFGDPSSIESTADALTMQRDATQKFIDDLIRQSTEIPAAIADAQRELSTLQVEPAVNADKIAQVRGVIANLQADLAALPQTIESAASRYDALTAALERVQAILTQQDQTLRNVQVGMAGLLPTIDETQQSMTRFAYATVLIAEGFAALDFGRITAGLNAVAAGAQSAAEGVTKTALDLGQIANQVSTNAINSMFNLGLQMMQGMSDGMNAGQQILLQVVQGIIRGVIAYFTGGFAIFSPSRVAMGWGENVTKGLAIGLANEVPRLERTWAATLDTLRPPAQLRTTPITQKVDVVYDRLPRVPDLDTLTQAVMLAYTLDTAPDLDPLSQSVLLSYLAADAPELSDLSQRVGLQYGVLPRAPDLERLQQEIGLRYGELQAPVLPTLADATQQITLVYDRLPRMPELDPITQSVEFSYAALDVPAPEPLAVPAVTQAAQLDPVVNVYVDSLFADPQAEARKVGSQVFLREGFTVAREGGFRG